MQSKSKDETGRFMKAIAAFSALPENVTTLGRALQSDPAGAGQAVLTEINETVLHRNLIFSSANGERIELDVSERRVLSVKSVSPKLSARHSGLVGRGLTAEDAGRFLSLCMDLGVNDARIHVVSALPDATHKTFGGIPVHVLSKAQNAGAGSDFPAVIDKTLSACEQMTLAFVVLRTGDVLRRGGEAAVLNPLTVALQQWQPPEATRDCVIAWGHSSGAADSTILVSLDGISVAAVCKPDDMPACFALWHQAVFGSTSEGA